MEDTAIEARAMMVASHFGGIVQRDDFYTGHLAASPDPDLFAVREAVDQDEESLESMDRFTRDIPAMSDSEVRLALSKLMEQQTWIAQMSASALRSKFDQAIVSTGPD